MSKNTLSNKHKNKVNIHDNTCHEHEYITPKTLETHVLELRRKISELSHDDLISSDDNKHIDWSVRQDINICPDNIELDISQYEPNIDHNKLCNVNENEHIDWSVEQDINIHPNNTSIALSHSELENMDGDEHIPHSRISIRPGSGLAGGGTLETSRSLYVRPATENSIGGIKIGYGLTSSVKDNKLNVDTNIFPSKYEFEIKKDELEKINSKYSYSFDVKTNFPCITCWDTKNSKIVYPVIKQNGEKITIETKTKIDLLVKVME